MVRQSSNAGSLAHAPSLDRLRRHSRSVQVKVIHDDREIDAFQMSDPQCLRAELRYVYRFLSEAGGVVRMRGVEEAWLPLGIDREHREVELNNVGEALSFLAA